VRSGEQLGLLEPRRRIGNPAQQFRAGLQRLLEAGYHVAFSSNQDNHCANWGASAANRSAVLLPQGVALTRASFLDALRARRVFATMDKDAQLVLTANGHLMGERFANSGPLRLQVHYASAGGRRAAAVAKSSKASRAGMANPACCPSAPTPKWCRRPARISTMPG
jgi:hypothetical protein